MYNLSISNDFANYEYFAARINILQMFFFKKFIG